RELHHAFIQRRLDLAEVQVAERRTRIARIQMVRQVERFGAEFDRLFFANPELSRESHIDPDASRPLNVAYARVPVLADCGSLAELTTPSAPLFGGFATFYYWRSHPSFPRRRNAQKRGNTAQTLGSVCDLWEQVSQKRG